MGIANRKSNKIYMKMIETKKRKELLKQYAFFQNTRNVLTCRKAKAWLDEHQIPYTDRHIVEENPVVEELKAWHQMSGIPLKKFFNTSGMLYKELNLKAKLPAMSEEEQYALLATNGMLVKRPLLIDGEKILIGFKEKEWEALLDE